jgi:GTP-binding protein
LGWKGKTFIISALTGEGCQALVYAVMDHLDLEQRTNAAATAAASPDEAPGANAGSMQAHENTRA